MKLEQAVTGDEGHIIGFVYIAGPRFEAWKRERLQSSTPGNKHTYIGTFDTVESAVAAIKGA